MPETTSKLPDVQRKTLQLGFNGKWDPVHDPLLIGKENYSDIQNLRYKDKGLKGVMGYSKINSTAL